MNPTTAIYYNNIYSKSKEYAKDNPEQSVYYNLFSDVVSMVPSGASVVELGCGTGLLAKMLIENGFHYVEGIDFSKVAIKKAKEINVQQQSLFKIADIYTYKPKKDATVICLETLEHLEYDIKVIENLPKCNFIFSVPNFMCESHQRCFVTQNQIIDRYGKYIEIESMAKIPVSKKNSVWLIKSKKE